MKQVPRKKAAPPAPDRRQPAAGAELTVEARRLEAQLNLIQRHMRQALQAEFARGQLTGPQRLVMETLVHAPNGLSLKELSRSVSLAHSTVSGIADRLEKQGLLVRETDAQDRRITRLMPSQAVRDFLAVRMPELTMHPLVEVLRRTSPSDRQAIALGLDTLARLISDAAPAE
jgi:DNA-binding MarR family transcriptional regulator